MNEISMIENYLCKNENDVMNWNDLKLFLAVSSQRSLIGAAEELGVSNTTVFRHLNAFEEGLGARLFERRKGDYELTELGEEMLQLAQGIENSFEDIERKVAGKDTKPSGKVVLTAPSSFSYGFLPGYLRDFKQLHPAIDVELLVTNQELNMSNRTADIALRVASAPPEHLVGRKVRSIKWGIYASKSYLEDNESPTDERSLAGHRVIGSTGALGTKPGFSWLDKILSQDITQRCDDLLGMSHLAAAGHGLVLLPDDVRHPELQRCFSFTPAGENRLWILTHPDLRKIERIKILMRFLAAAFAADERLGKI